MTSVSVHGSIRICSCCLLRVAGREGQPVARGRKVEQCSRLLASQDLELQLSLWRPPAERKDSKGKNETYG
jgi:hypothetical protein